MEKKQDESSQKAGMDDWVGGVPGKSIGQSWFARVITRSLQHGVSGDSIPIPQLMNPRSVLTGI